MIRLRIDNPYSTGIIQQFKNGTLALDRFKINHKPNEKDALHVVQDFDTLSSLSGKYYKNSKYWWIIADTNNIDDPFTLAVGTVLIIPDLITFKTLHL